MKLFEVKRKVIICTCYRSNCICENKFFEATKYGVSFIQNNNKVNREFWTESAREQFINTLTTK